MNLFDTEEIIQFGPCEVRFGTREIFLYGKLRSAEPRVFDTLAYLIAHADKVVSKDELLQAVWKTQFASDTVVAQCIMKMRRTIGDTNNECPLVKTVQRAGYRFIAPFVRKKTRPTPPRSSAARERIAVLPVSRSAGTEDLQWVEFGLASLMIRAFELQGGFVTVPLLDIAEVLQPIYCHLPAGERATLLREQLQIDTVVAAHVTRENHLEPCIKYTVYAAGAEPFEGCCEGAALATLAVEVAHRICEESRKRRGVRCHGPFDGDPFLAEAYSRGLRAAEHDFRQTALGYFQICVGVEPHALTVDIEYIKQLAAVVDPATPKRATEVLERAALLGDNGAAMKILSALSTYYTGAMLNARMPAWLRSSM